MKIQRLQQSTATLAPTWIDTPYKTLKEAREANPHEYANWFRIKRAVDGGFPAPESIAGIPVSELMTTVDSHLRPTGPMEACTHCAGTGEVSSIGEPFPRVFRWKDYKLTRES